MRSLLRLALFLSLVIPCWANARESTCFGTPGNGRVEGAVRLPESGSNYVPYSSLGVSVGRTYVHSRVGRVVSDAYASLAETQPEKVFMYGESGWAGGGRFKPHRTHQNGLAVDFMVSVLNADGKSVPLPTSLINKFGYGIEFDAAGKYEDLQIDFEAIAEHLHAMHMAASQNGVGVSRVIFDPVYIPKLYASRRGAFIRQHITFMQGQAWVRHDEHYHVDFLITCKPM